MLLFYQLLSSHLHTVMNRCCSVLISRSSFTIVSSGNDRNSESLSINIVYLKVPSPGEKVIIFSTFSVISGSCNRLSVTPEVPSPNTHHSLSPLQSLTN